MNPAVLDNLADIQSAMLRHTYRTPAEDPEDRDAQADVEGLRTFQRAGLNRFRVISNSEEDT